MKCKLDVKLDIVNQVVLDLESNPYITHSKSVTMPLNYKGRTNLYSAINSFEKINKAYGDENLVKFDFDSNSIFINPSEELINEYFTEWERRNLSSRNRDLELSNKALEEQDEKETIDLLSNISEKIFTTKGAAISYLKIASTNPYFYKLVQKGKGWTAELRDEYRGFEKEINNLENCR